MFKISFKIKRNSPNLNWNREEKSSFVYFRNFAKVWTEQNYHTNVSVLSLYSYGIWSEYIHTVQLRDWNWNQNVKLLQSHTYYWERGRVLRIFLPPKKTMLLVKQFLLNFICFAKLLASKIFFSNIFLWSQALKTINAGRNLNWGSCSEQQHYKLLSALISSIDCCYTHTHTLIVLITFYISHNKFQQQ